MNPGERVASPRSMTCAPCGMAMPLPASTILSPSTTTTALVISALPLPSNIRAAFRAIVAFVCAKALVAIAEANNKDIGRVNFILAGYRTFAVGARRCLCRAGPGDPASRYRKAGQTAGSATPPYSSPSTRLHLTRSVTLTPRDMNRLLLCLALFPLWLNAQPASDGPLQQMAADFWKWRAQYAPFSGDDVNRIERPGGMRDWSRASIDKRRADLAD